MKAWVTVNPVGKTSAWVLLAFDFAERGLQVVVIALDTQANAYTTLMAYRSGLTASGLCVADYDAANLAAATMNRFLVEADHGLADRVKHESADDTSGQFRAAIASLDVQGFAAGLNDTAPFIVITSATALYSANCVDNKMESN